MGKFEHKGFSIVLAPSGLFHIENRPDLAPQESYAGAKAEIDRSLKAERKPIQALMFTGARYDSTYDGIATVTVTSAVPNRWGGGGDAWVKTKNGGRSKESTRDVYLETPENMATMQEVVALTKDVKRLRDKIEKLKATLKTVPVEGAKQ
jgi:hypothetical protein